MPHRVFDDCKAAEKFAKELPKDSFPDISYGSTTMVTWTEDEEECRTDVNHEGNTLDY